MKTNAACSLSRENTSMIHSTKKYTAGCYCRLSDDDDQDGTSISIETQKKILGTYCAEQGIAVYDFYQDDGYTGTNFRRPAFQRMIHDAEAGVINTIIVKDLSRFGRNYVECGSYLSDFFPEYGIRFVAISDNVDSENGNLDYDLMIPIKNVFNEWYPADCSRKVRQAFRTKASAGEYIGAFAPYGYRKSDEDKHVLEIDDETAPHVLWMFEMVAYHAYGYDRIARTLQERKILTPTAYHAWKAGKPFKGNPYEWNNITIYRLFENEVYLGKLVSGKRRKLSYKSKTVIRVPKDEWIMIDHQFPQLISDQLWQDAHDALKSRKKRMKSGELNLFAGLLKCASCGHALGITGGQGCTRYYVCNIYKRKGPTVCSSHYILYQDVYNAVLSEIQNLMKHLEEDRDTFLKLILDKMDKKMKEQYKEQEDRRGALELVIASCRKRFDQLYEDHVTGLLSDRKFKELSDRCETEQSKAEEQLEKIPRSSYDRSAFKEQIQDFIGAADQFGMVTELNIELLNRLIEKIEVGERVYEGKQATQTLTIHFKVIGAASTDIKNEDKTRN